MNRLLHFLFVGFLVCIFGYEKSQANPTITAKTPPKSSTQNYKIAVILPTTGKKSRMAQRALNAIRLSIKNSKNISLILFDTQANPVLAKQAVEKIAKDSSIIAILGGLTGKESNEISEQTEKHHIPFFSFSQKSNLTDNKLYTFRNAITPEMQAEQLIQFAFKKLNVKKFAILFPNDPYGVEYANKIWNLTLAGGGEIVAAQTYDPKDTNLSIYIQKLLGTYHYEARLEEYKKRKRLISRKFRQSRSQREHLATEDILKPIVDFDVLFIPDQSKALGVIDAYMKSYGVFKMTYLGTNLWNTNSLIQRMDKTDTKIFFVDSLFQENDFKRSDFFRHYFALYKEEPSLIEAQIFESTEIVKNIIEQKFSTQQNITRSYLAYSLSSLNITSGLDKKIQMNNNNEIERNLQIYTLANGKIKKFIE